MPALAERTKIKKEWASIPTTQAFSTIENLSSRVKLFMASIDDYVYDFPCASTRIVMQSYLPTPSAKAKEFLRKINSYKNLSQNWDNNGAVPPASELILKASTFIQVGDEFDLPLYFTAPGPNGEIIIEYKNSTNAAEIFFNEDSSEEMILYSGNEQTYAGGLDMNLLFQHLK